MRNAQQLDTPPTEDEAYDITHRFGVDSAHLKELISRIRFDKNGQEERRR